MRLHPNSLGLAIGALMALWHAFWAVLVAVGLAQPLMNFIFWAHFLNQPFSVQPFEFARAAALVVVTGLIGYIVGAVAGLIWNRLQR